MNTLIINRSDSQCSNCGKGANPNAKHHTEVLGYGPASEGCGQLFTHVTSNYYGMRDVCEVMRPDLIWIDQP